MYVRDASPGDVIETTTGHYRPTGNVYRILTLDWGNNWAAARVARCGRATFYVSLDAHCRRLPDDTPGFDDTAA